jgi:hypothetical protein
MLTQLLTLKSRLALSPFEPAEDALLTTAIRAVSARFDRECCRTFARSVDAIEEFNGDEREIRPAGYPIESIRKFELKRTESEGWVEQPAIEYLIRSGCVVSLAWSLGTPGEQARLTFTGGYVLPGTNPAPGQTPLPDDLEQAAIEQIVFWYQNRDKVGVMRQWPKGGTYEQFQDLDLLPNVRAVLRKYTRCLA